MKRAVYFRTLIALACALLLLGSTDILAQRPALKKRTTVRKAAAAVKPVEPVYTVNTGTVMRARMNQTLHSKRTAVGSTFTAAVTEPVYSSTGVVVIPVGSTLNGRVSSVRPAAKGGVPGQIDVTFTSVRLPNGRIRSINGSLTDLEAGKTRSDSEGGVSGKKMDHRKVVFIGGGTAGGAILGAMVGGGKATAIGAILGAGAGFLGERYMKGPEAEVKSGTEFSVQLNQAISLPRFAEAGAQL
jgi:hypothetical protein